MVFIGRCLLVPDGGVDGVCWCVHKSATWNGGKFWCTVERQCRDLVWYSAATFVEV